MSTKPKGKAGYTGNYKKLVEKACPVCGKPFIVLSEDWVYKTKSKHEFVCFCSWKCLRKHEAEEEARKVKNPRQKKGVGDVVKDMLQNGATSEEIKDAVGVCTGTVTYYKKKLGML